MEEINTFQKIIIKFRKKVYEGIRYIYPIEEEKGLHRALEILAEAEAEMLLGSVHEEKTGVLLGPVHEEEER